jgi:Cu/Ag efflux protein CusF
MKTKSLRRIAAAGLTLATLALAPGASADPAPNAAPREKSCTGMITAVNPQERVLTVRWFLFHKKFNLGEHCACNLVANSTGSIDELRPGQKVRVSYQNASGVLIADRVVQIPMHYEGMVKAINPDTRKLTLHLRGLDKQFVIGDKCKVVLRDDKAGRLADIQPGQHVTVIYESPSGKLTVRQIDQTSAAYTGKLTAVDASDHTVKVQHLGSTTRFHLADNCAILADGRLNGQLRDLELGDTVTLNYDEIDGVKVANRIVSGTAPAPSLSAKAAEGPNRN